MKKCVNKILPENIKAQTGFTAKRFSTCFKTNDRTKFEHQHNVIISGEKCSAENCPDNYVGKSERCIIERVKDHSGRDIKSHVLKHSSEKEHEEVMQEDFKIIGIPFKNNRPEWNIAETFLIKQERPSLNAQDQSVGAKIAQLMSLSQYYQTNSLMTRIYVAWEPDGWFALWMDWCVSIWLNWRHENVNLVETFIASF